MEAPEDSEPTLREGLAQGYRESRQMLFIPRGRLTILVILGSMFWLFFLAPIAWMKLEQVFPKTGIGFFVCLAMYFSWLLFLFMAGVARRIMRNMRLFGKPKPSLKEDMPYMKETIKSGYRGITKDN